MLKIIIWKKNWQYLIYVADDPCHICIDVNFVPYDKASNENFLTTKFPDVWYIMQYALTIYFELRLPIQLQWRYEQKIHPDYPY